MKTNYLINNDNLNTLKSFIDKKLNYIEHDQFVFGPTVYGVCYFNIDSKDYAIESRLQNGYYLLDNEEIAQFIINSNIDCKASRLENEAMVKEKIEQTIRKITLLNANYQIHENNKILDEIDMTYGIIFTLDNDYQISLNEPFDLSEVIQILKGYELEQIIKYRENPNDGWEDDDVIKYTPSVTYSQLIIE